MKENYLKLAECYEKLAENYRAMAESTAESAEAVQTTAAKAEEKADEQSVTFEDISTLAKKKAAEGKSAEVKAVITECGVKKLSDIPEDLYADVFKKLEAV